MSLYQTEDRNIRALGEETQRKLKELHVLVSGSGTLSQIFLSALAGLGVGRITIIDNERINPEDLNEFLCFNNNPNKKKIESIKEILNKINPVVKIDTYYSKLNKFLISDNPNVIVDATNSIMSKIDSLNLSKEYNVPFLSAFSNKNKGVMICSSPKISLEDSLECLLQEFDELDYGDVTNGIMAGILSSEILRIASPNLEEEINQSSTKNKDNKELFKITYNLCSNNRWNGDELKYVDYSMSNSLNKKILLVGAGALGNFVGLNLSLMGVGEITIIDDDKIEQTNLNRQVLFYGQVGRYKAEVLAEKLNEISPIIKAKHYIERFNEKNRDMINANHYDLIFSCVDSFETRFLLDKCAEEHRIPLINGQTYAFGGELQVYWPKFSKSINNQIDLEGMIEVLKEEKPKNQRSGCANNPYPSIITPNLIIGSAMVGEAKIIFEKHNHNKLNGRLFYEYPRSYGLKEPLNLVDTQNLWKNGF